MTYSPDAQARLAGRLRDLFPDADGFAFDTALTSSGGDGELVGLIVSLPDAAFDDFPDGTAHPGAALAETLRSLGWAPGSADGDPVDDDVPLVTFNRPRPESPVRLHELWQLIEAAYADARDSRDLSLR